MTTENLDEEKQVSFMDFELFKKIFGVRIVSIGLECPNCKSIWGFKIYDEKNITQIRSNKMVCYRCANKKVNLETEQLQEKQL